MSSILSTVTRRPATLCQTKRRLLSTSTTLASSSRKRINIVEVGPRDGLQNEPSVISASLKTELIDRLARSGLRTTIEAGSFVSPKWVPRMAGTDQVMRSRELRELKRDYLDTVRFSVLVPNEKGMKDVDALIKEFEKDEPEEGEINGRPNTIDEIAVFIAATQAFSMANLNCSISDSVDRIQPLINTAIQRFGIKVRGYISVAINCPYQGRVDPLVVQTLADKLVQMGCYQVSIADTVGTATPSEMEACFNEVVKAVPLDKLALHCHDTYGTAVSTVLHMARLGVTTIDSAIAGLGGCPYSPGATGNVATEDVIYALEGEGYDTGILPPDTVSASQSLLSTASSLQSFAQNNIIDQGNRFDWERADALLPIAHVGAWISEQLNRQNSSRVGKALIASKAFQLQKAREQQEKQRLELEQNEKNAKKKV